MKVFLNGLQRSGTNYILKLFRQNLPSIKFKNCITLYFKHDFFRGHFLNNPPDKILTVIKHPYSWVESICFRNCVDIKRWFTNYYLHNPKDHCGPFSINLKNLCELYHDFYDTWLDVPQTRLIHYESILKPKDVHKIIHKHFDIDLKIEDIKIPKQVPQSHDFVHERKEIYSNYKTQYLNDIQKQIIKECLPKNFLKRIKYNLN